MPRVYERAFRVRHYECNAYGHVNHANYLRYMQEAAMDASAAVGYDLDRYAALHRQWWIRETEIEYLRPVRYGQTVIVKTWVEDFHRVRSRRAYELRDADSGEIVARAHSDWVYMNTDTGRPVTVPDEMIAAFEPEVSPDGRTPRTPFPDAPPHRLARTGCAARSNGAISTQRVTSTTRTTWRTARMRVSTSRRRSGGRWRA